MTEDGPQEQAAGDWCAVCGTACEVWPLKTKDEVLKMIQESRSFRKQFNEVRAGVSAAEASFLRAQQVSAFRGSGMRIVLRAAFVESDIFKVYFKVPPQSINQKCVTVTGPENVQLEGVVLSLQEFPLDLPHYEVELFGYTERRLEDVLLAPNELRREGHASDRYTYACKALVKEREPSMKCQGMQRLLSCTECLTHAESVLKKRAENDAGLGMQTMNAPLSSTFKVVTNSTLEDGHTHQPIATPVVGGRPRGGANLAASRRMRAGKAAARGFAAPSVASASTMVTAKGASASIVSADQVGGASPGSVVFSLNDSTDGQELVQGFDVMKILNGWMPGRELKKACGHECASFLC